MIHHIPARTQRNQTKYLNEMKVWIEMSHMCVKIKLATIISTKQRHILLLLAAIPINEN